jgi:hypothetical protein
MHFTMFICQLCKCAMSGGVKGVRRLLLKSRPQPPLNRDARRLLSCLKEIAQCCGEWKRVSM